MFLMMVNQVAQCPPFEQPQSFSKRFKCKRVIQGELSRILHFLNKVHAARDGDRYGQDADRGGVH